MSMERQTGDWSVKSALQPRTFYGPLAPCDRALIEGKFYDHPTDPAKLVRDDMSDICSMDMQRFIDEFGRLADFLESRGIGHVAPTYHGVFGNTERSQELLTTVDRVQGIALGDLHTFPGLVFDSIPEVEFNNLFMSLIDYAYNAHKKKQPVLDELLSPRQYMYDTVQKKFTLVDVGPFAITDTEAQSPTGALWQLTDDISDMLAQLSRRYDGDLFASKQYLLEAARTVFPPEACEGIQDQLNGAFLE